MGPGRWRSSWAGDFDVTWAFDLDWRNGTMKAAKIRMKITAGVAGSSGAWVGDRPGGGLAVRILMGAHFRDYMCTHV